MKWVLGLVCENVSKTEATNTHTRQVKRPNARRSFNGKPVPLPLWTTNSIPNIMGSNNECQQKRITQQQQQRKKMSEKETLFRIYIYRSMWCVCEFCIRIHVLALAWRRLPFSHYYALLCLLGIKIHVQWMLYLFMYTFTGCDYVRLFIRFYLFTFLYTHRDSSFSCFSLTLLWVSEWVSVSCCCHYQCW